MRKHPVLKWVLPPRSKNKWYRTIVSLVFFIIVIIITIIIIIIIIIIISVYFYYYYYCDNLFFSWVKRIAPIEKSEWNEVG